MQGRISPETAQITRDYSSPVPLFASGTDAAAHGMRDIEHPDGEACRTIDKIIRVRSDIAEILPE